MIRIFSVLLVGLLLISGCNQAPKKLTFLVGGPPQEIAVWQKVIAKFTNETKIPIEIIQQPSDANSRQQSTIVALRGKQVDPDILLVDLAWFGELAANNWLEPLDKYQIDSKPFFSSIINLADTFNGHLIALPVYVDGGMLYYRTDLLTKYGYTSAPKTWDELITMATNIQAKERAAGNKDFWGFAWQGAQAECVVCDALEFFTTAGGGFMDANMNPIFNSPENVQALQLMVDFIQKYKISPPNTYTTMKEEEVREMFQNGNAMFERNWPYAGGLHNQTNSAVKGMFTIAPLPSFPGKKSASTLGGWHAAISVYSDMKEEAAQFLKYITSFEAQKIFAMELGWNPARMDVYNDAETVAKTRI